MNSTPNCNRTQIGIFGNTNVGKSSFFNMIVGSKVSIVSKEEGTTTDAVSKAMELIPIGPVNFIDTAGINDNSILGKERVKKTNEIIKKVDIGILIIDGKNHNDNNMELIRLFEKYKIPFLKIINKADLLKEVEKEAIQKNFGNVKFLSTKTGEGKEEIITQLINTIQINENEEATIKELVPYGSTVVLVVPIDSEAPKGRLILPQVQCIRECLDSGIKCIVVRDSELEDIIKEKTKIDLVITDSQIFNKVEKIVPKDIMLTSFSMILAWKKGDFHEFLNGIEAIKKLKPGDKVLISECCTHNTSHEDIGEKKIPKLLNNYVSGKLEFTFYKGGDFSLENKDYKVIIHCGGCMITRKDMRNRISDAKEKEIPITNYGMILAFFCGILDRSSKLFL